MAQLYGHNYSHKDLARRTGLLEQVAGIRPDRACRWLGARRAGRAPAHRQRLSAPPCLSTAG